MPNVLTLDLGTTYFKAAVFDEHGSMLALASRETPIDHPGARRVEVAPEAFLAVVGRLIRELRVQDARAVEGAATLSFASQTNSFILLDTEGRPLTPIILWPDARAVDISLPEVNDYAETGVVDLTHEFMIAKLLWLRENELPTWRQATRLCLISDYLTLYLTGQHVTEAGVAGLTGLIDIHRLRWRETALRRIGLSRSLLPRIVRAGTDLGAIVGQRAEQLGLAAGCRLVVGCLDQYAGAIAAGNVVPGIVSETTGTVLATVCCAHRFDPSLVDRGVFQGPSFAPDCYYRMVFGNTAANLIEALRLQQDDNPTYEQLMAEAANVPPGCNELLAVGLDPMSRSVVFSNQSANHTRGHAVRAVLEAVAEALRDQVQVLTANVVPDGIRSLGGAARSGLWQQIKANTLSLPVSNLACEEPTSLGAAILGLCHGNAQRLRELAEQSSQSRTVFAPDR